MDRAILYVNPLTFPIAVERVAQRSTRLAGRPMALAGRTARAIIWSASRSGARRRHVGMPIYQAYAAADLVLLPPRWPLPPRRAALERILSLRRCRAAHAGARLR
jgi:hypothetical protein